MKLRFPILFLCVCLAKMGSAKNHLDTAAFNKRSKEIDKVLEIKVDSAYSLIKDALSNSLRNKYAYGHAKSNLQLARFYTLKGKVDSALLYLPTAIKYARASKDTTIIVNSYLFYARALSTAAQYNKAIEEALAAQRYAEKLKDNKIKIKLNHDLGFVHSAIGLHVKAIHYYKIGLAIGKATNDTFNCANISARLGGEFHYIKQYDSALVYNLQGLKLFKSINHKRGIGASMVNLASTYTSLNQIKKAIQVTEEAIKIREELGDTYAVTMLKLNLTECYIQEKQFKKALDLAIEGRKLAQEQNETELIQQNYNALRRIYHALNQNDSAYAYASKVIAVKDSIFENTNLKAINELQTKYETDQKEKEIKLLQLESKNAEEKSQAERKTRNLIIFSISLIALLIGIFTVLLYKRFKVSNKQKEIIEKQKEQVDEKNKEVTDSINYALTIQQSVIPSEKDLKEGVTDTMVFFKPKDIVSGDFYWHTTVQDYLFYVVADCTGHGVPGAFMSMMGINYLSEIINEKEVTDTAKILNLLREKVIFNLNKSNTSGQKRDGMDMSIIRIHRSSLEMQFSGANNSFYLLRGDQLEELKGDKMPIGLHSGEHMAFGSKTIQLHKKDKLFSFTDGLPDQFGGPKGKKFMRKQVEQLLIEYTNEPLANFKQHLNYSFDSWKGLNEQIDDITLIGIQI